MSALSDLFGNGDGGYSDIRQLMDNNKYLYDNLETPDYSEYVPDLYNTESANYQLTQDDPVTKSAQMSALNKMADLADTGMSPEDEAGYFKARQLGSQVARTGTENALQNAQARGVAGGGMEFAMREAANQEAGQRAQEAALTQAADSARQKALYNQAYMTGTGQMRDQDYRTNSANTNIVNQFNQANTQARNETGQANTAAKNDAFKYNQGLKDKDFANQVTKIQGQTGATTGIANSIAAHGASEQADQNALLGIGGQVGAAYAGRK